MELQLGLALPVPTNPSKGLDLNSCAYDPNHLVFSSFPWSHKKRSFTQLFEHDTANTQVLFPTLPLLPLTPGHPNHDDAPQDPHHSNCSTITNRNDGDDVEARVGWPPLNTWRKKLRYDNYGDEAAEGIDQMVWIHHHHQQQQQQHCRSSVGVRGSNGLYVKVKMEGVGIARKVDLSMHHSFQELKETLMDMFGKCHQHSNCYKLAYQDREGDWLLAEDVPWSSFIGCAQRLKLLKSSG